MALQQPQLILGYNGVADLLLKANAHLAAGELGRALPLYTNILYTVCPGHICAFLNRALVYILIGYPELAVMDSYRAASLCHISRQQEPRPIGTQYLCDEIYKYLRSERLQALTRIQWTRLTDRHVGLGWLSADLACIVITRGMKSFSRTDTPWDGLETRALYRMCGALMLCGLGAKSDALGIIEDTVTAGSGRSYRLTDQEKQQFRSLGDQTLGDCGVDLSANRELSISMMKWKATLVNRVIYPWNTDVVDTKTFEHVEELETLPDPAAKSCTVRHTDATPISGSTLRLIAAEDIYTEELVLREEGLLQVTTVDPIGEKGYFCDTCAAVILFTERAHSKLSTQSPPSQRSWPLFEAAAGASTAVESPSTYIDRLLNVAEIEAQKAEGFPYVSYHTDTDILARTQLPIPQPDTGLKATPDFHHCHACFETNWCEGDCFAFAGDHYAKLCMTGIESDVRKDCRFKTTKLTSDDLIAFKNDFIIHPKERCLYELLFVRILSIAIDRKKEILLLPEIKRLNGDLRSANPIAPANDPALVPALSESWCPQTRKLPWTFKNNVQQPDYFLRRMGFDPISNLAEVDGWVLNTLYAKVMQSTRITKGARHAMIYDETEKLVSAESPAPKPVDEDVWVGSLNLVFSITRLADASNGKKANVVVSEGMDVKCFSLSRRQSSEDRGSADMDIDKSNAENQSELKVLCIKRGEDILRSAE